MRDKANRSKSAKPFITRRRFLGGTLAVTAASSLGTLGSRAADAATNAPKPAMFTRKVKVGFVGCGGRGSWLAKFFHNHGGYSVHAVADYFQTAADTCGDAFGVDKARRFSGLSGYQRLMDSGVEAVVLETPPYFFPGHARAAVERRLHVYMAKPVAVDVPGCLEIETAAKKSTANRRVFLADYQIPTDPHNVEVVKRIRAGEIGTALALNSHYFASGPYDPPLTETIESRLHKLIWVNDVALGGGHHVNACIHGVDAALWVAEQRPVAAMGLSLRGRAQAHGDSHDVFELVFEFANGLIMSHRGKHLANQLGFDVVCQVLGQTGYAQICYGGKASLRGYEDAYSGEVQNLYEAGALRNIAAFFDCITRDSFANDTARRGVDGALATILGREAALRRTRLTLDNLLKENKRLEVDLRGLKA